MIICATPPVSGGIVSRFGPRRGRVTGATTQHAGVDFRARRGDPVYAAVDGVVQAVGHDQPHGQREGTRFVGGGPFSGFGNCVSIADGRGWYLFTAHMDTLLVERGQAVRRGQVIGTVGSTSNGKFDGSATSMSPGRPMGPHAHFETSRMPYPKRYGAGNENPQIYLSGHGVTYAGGFAPTVVASCRLRGLSGGLAGPPPESAPLETSSATDVEYEPAEAEILLDWAPTLVWTGVGVGASALVLGGLAWALSSRR